MKILSLTSLFILMSACSQDYGFHGEVDAPEGVSGADILVSPATLNYGAVNQGETAVKNFTIQNVGTDTLTIKELSLTEGTSFTIITGAPNKLEPAEFVDIEVAYSPLLDDAETGLIEIKSNDDDTPVATVSLEAQPIISSSPVAICYADPAELEPINDSTTWIGDESHDPNGYAIVTYNWSLVTAPAGSAAIMPGAGPSPVANRGPFVPDLAGTYEAQLIVTNELGEESAPCIASAEVIPGENFWIEMFWTHNNDDMDLHLLRPDTTYGQLESNRDCYYANCVGGGLNWGSSSSSIDDVFLDLDDIPGTGPENINIDEPESGTFSIYVHDYPGSSYSPANDVTVNIYVGGVLSWTKTKSISGEDSYTPFAEVTYPGGAISDL